MVIDDILLNELLAKAAESPRLRQNYDLLIHRSGC